MQFSDHTTHRRETVGDDGFQFIERISYIDSTLWIHAIIVQHLQNEQLSSLALEACGDAAMRLMRHALMHEEVKNPWST